MDNPDNESKVFFIPEATAWETVNDKIERQIVGYNDSIMMVNVRFKKGGVGSLHKHVHKQLTYISEGVFEVSIGNQKAILGKGSSFLVPSNEIHGVVCLEEGLLADVFSPIREDFLNN